MREPSIDPLARRLAERIEQPSADADLDIDKALSAVHKRAGISPVSTSRRLNPWTRIWKPARWALGAGLMFAAIVLGRSTLDKARNGVAEVREYTTAVREITTVTLPDGSVADLAPATTLRYAGTSSGRRLIELTGQARFRVQHDPSRPFTVRTPLALTTVLGTEFDVRQYGDEHTVQVAVVTGKVATGPVLEPGGTAGEPLVITPGQVALVNDSAGYVATSVKASDVTQWTSGQFVFTSVPASQVLETFSRWTGYAVVFADSSLAGERVSMVLSINNIPRALAALRDLLDVRLSVDGNVITLTPDSASRSNTRTPTTPAPKRGGGSELFPRTSEVGR